MRVEVQLPISATKIQPYSEYILKRCGMETEMNALGVRGRSDLSKIEVLVKTAFNWKASSIRMAVESDNEEACKIVKMLLMDEYTYGQWYYETYSKLPKTKDVIPSTSEGPSFAQTFIFDTNRKETYYFMRWLLDDAHFEKIHGSISGDRITATYKNIASISLQLIEDDVNSTRCLLMSGREDMIKAFDELINKRKFYERWLTKYPFKKSIAMEQQIVVEMEELRSGDLPKEKESRNVEELSIYIPAMSDHKSFFLYVVLPLGYSKLQSKTNCYSAISPTGHKATFKYLGGFRQPLTFSIESDSPEELEELVSLFSDPNVSEKWKDEIAARKVRDAQRKAAQKQAAEAEQYERDQKKLAKLQVDYYEKLARCPKCGSTSLSGHKKGFGIGKAVTGAALTSLIYAPLAPFGLIAGNKGAKKLYVTCLNCGHKWKTKK